MVTNQSCVSFQEPKPDPPAGAAEKKPHQPKKRKPKMTADMYGMCICLVLGTLNTYLGL